MPERPQHHPMNPTVRSTTVLIGLVSTVAMASIPSVAQAVPVLSKEWKGIATVTAMGAPTQLHPQHASNLTTGKAPITWNAYEETRTLQIIRQQGRHLELALTSPRGYRRLMLGTLSADGRQLQIVDSTRDFSMTIAGDTMSGCGSVRGGDGTFDHFITNHAAICWDFTAVK